MPLTLLACGASAKKLARGSPWIAEDFFLGVELTLATLGAGLMNLVYVIRSAVDFDHRITANLLFFAIGFFLLLWMLAVHRDWLSRPQNRKGQLFWLLGVCNLVAVCLMMAFIVFTQGRRDMKKRPEQRISAILAVLAVGAAAVSAGVAGLFDGAAFSPQLAILLLAALASLGAALAAISANRHAINRRRSKRVFIICAAEDLDSARQVAAYIRSAGWEPWLPADHILPGQVWRGTLVEAIRRSGAAVLVVSENFRLSRVAHEELSVASRLLRGRRRAFSPIIPARLDYSVPPDMLKRVRMADLRTSEGPEQLLRGIAEVLL